MKWFMVCMRRYADFAGRARRSEYWWFALINAVVAGVLYAIAMVAMLGASATIDPETGQGSGLGIIAMIPLSLLGLWSLAMFIPGLSVTVRRLHDTSRSGWWILISFVPLVGAIILLVFECMDSTPGQNQWGPNPKGVGGAAYGQFQPGQGQYGQLQPGQPGF